MCGIGTDWLKAGRENAGEADFLQPKFDRALVIFVKNPILGKVKTRLAKTMGDQAALDAYLQMLAHVRATTEAVDCHRAVFYSDFINENDEWARPTFSKYLQASGDLGDRMRLAMEAMFAEGYQKVALVGSDFLDLQVQHLERAFRGLELEDFVLGPAHDGGYYLIGMKVLEPSVFKDKPWSSDVVFSETLAEVHRLGKTAYVLPEIQDIDEETDWIAALARQQARQIPT